jgi:hypothetical protein
LMPLQLTSATVNKTAAKNFIMGCKSTLFQQMLRNSPGLQENGR